jgi:hypothetical protein
MMKMQFKDYVLAFVGIVGAPVWMLVAIVACPLLLIKEFVWSKK